ncbi:MAG: collagenase [Colwellia sp.]|nr:collagenase [Colwellia sp.]
MQHHIIKKALILASITASASSFAVSNSFYDTSALTIKHNCTSETTLYSEAAINSADICEGLSEVEVLFGERFGTSPVPGDKNNNLDFFIYQDRDSYEDANISPNSFGIYIEQDPSDANSNGELYSTPFTSGNIQNQSHEYTHYLDGRFNKDGDYHATDQAAWWTEGLAEYMQHLHWGNPSDYVKSTISSFGRDFSLETIFSLTKDDYNTNNYDLLYDGGNIVLCYFIQEEAGALDTLISHSRAGNWSAWSSELDNLESTYGDDFDDFVDDIYDDTKVCHLDTIADEPDTGTNNGDYQAPSPLPNTNWEHISSVTIASSSNNSGDDNGYGDYSSQAAFEVADNSSITLTSGASYDEDWRVWIDFDQNGSFEQDELVYSADNQQSTSGILDIPSSAVGTTTRMRIAMAYNNVSATGGFDGEIEDYTVTIVSGSGTGTDPDTGNGNQESYPVNVGNGDYQHIAIEVPAGTNSLTASLDKNGGSAMLMLNEGSEASARTYDDRDTGGNEVSINNPSSGTWYIAIRGRSSGISNGELVVTFN